MMFPLGRGVSACLLSDELNGFSEMDGFNGLIRTVAGLSKIRGKPLSGELRLRCELKWFLPV